jgi:hypothetical protein
MQKMLEFLFPQWFSSKHKCTLCGTVRDKSTMIHDVDGWFCNEEEANKFYQLRQW